MKKLTNILIVISFSNLLVAQLNPGQIGNNQSICYGSAPQMLVFTIQPSGGTSPYSYRWQRSNDNGTTWADIAGSTAAGITYSPQVLGRTAMFRCRITDAVNSSLNTNNVTITVTSDLIAGIIEDSQTVYASTVPETLRSSSMSSPSGGSGIYTFQWQRSNNGISWSNISDAVSEVYTPGALGSDTWFRRFVVDPVCGSTVSNSVKISVRQITLFSNELPASSGVDDFNLGTEFQALMDGYITKARVYTHESEQGDHIIRLYKRNGPSDYSIIAGPYTMSITPGEAGWKELILPEAISVEAGGIYLISSTTGNGYYVQSSQNFIASDNIYIDYLQGLYSFLPDGVPLSNFNGAHYFRDVVFSLFSPGSAGASQVICYNTSPLSLAQVTEPTGGTGDYTYQWQMSPNDTIWTNIEGAILTDYTPAPLTTNTYFRRVVKSANMTAYCPSVLITVNPEFSSAEIHDNITIFNNTLTNLYIDIVGGTAPYTVNYRRNGVLQPQITGYLSGSGIPTGVLSTGDYTYELVSITDANGCNAQAIGGSITVVVSGTYSPSVTNKALVMVNDASVHYNDFIYYIKPYLDNFGIPYDIFNSSSPADHPVFTDYALLIFAHKNVYDGITVEYPVADIILALQSGVGLYSFDPNLFSFTIGSISTSITSSSVTSNTISLANTDHFITQQHSDDKYNNTIWTGQYSNNYDLISLRSDLNANQNTSLASGSNLASMTQSGNSVAILEISSYGSGRVVKWNEYNWASESILGPVYGMDDLLWRSIVWAARKPFVMQGFPPIITMRVDDVDGTGLEGTIANDFEWISISNGYGFAPWCGTFTIPAEKIPIFKTFLDANNATASPHAFSYESSIYFNHEGDLIFDPVINTQTAHAFYTNNELKMSKLLIPHYYEIDPLALGEIQNMGIEFMGTHMDFGDPYNDFWINCAPFRTYMDVWGRSSDPLPVSYSGNISNGSFTFFNCVTEIRDDQGYEWYITGRTNADIIGQGVRQLSRSLNSMVLSTLFTHQDQLGISAQNWSNILSEITGAVAAFNPEYRSLDYGVQYARAKSNISITNVSDNDPIVNISYSGTNDMDTRCYLFTESSGLISSRQVVLPQISAGTVIVGVLK